MTLLHFYAVCGTQKAAPNQPGVAATNSVAVGARSCQLVYTAKPWTLTIAVNPNMTLK